MKTQKYNVELSDEAEDDFDKSYYYYAKESQKVATNFLKKADSTFIQISKNPEVYPTVYKDIRKVVLRNFPFVIYYKIKEKIVRIIAIFHTSRNPEIWMERAENE